ncbi:MAG: PAS domain S-box protein [Leptospira sp.]|nr:PAS domain S-box protein [Leptospira sp.]
MEDINQEIEEKEAQKKHEAFFEGILASSQGWVWEVDVDMNVISASSMIEEILGFSAEEVIGKSIYSLMKPEDAIKLQNDSTYQIDSRLPFYDTSFWCLSKDNREVLIRANAIPVYNIRGEYTGYKGIVEDITSEFILGERSRHKDLLLRDMKVGKWEYDSKSNQLMWNHAMYDLLEIDTSMEPSFTSFVELIHPDDRNSIKDMYQSAHANLTSLKVIHRLVLSDTKERWVRSEVRSFKNSDGSIRTIGYMQDVSELRNLEEELISQKNYLESIMNSLEASSIVSITDPNGKILKVNDQFCKVSGYSRDELLGNTHGLVNS